MAGESLSLAHFDSLGGSIADALVLVGEDGTIAYANEPAERLFARPDGLIGLDFGHPVPIGQTVDIEVLSDGEVRVAEMRSAHISLADGEFRVATLRDVTLRNRSERQLREALHLREEVIALAAHELRTPLTVVAGLSNTLREQWGGLTEVERQHLIERVAERSGELVGFVQRVLDRDHLDGWRAEPTDEHVGDLVNRVLENWPDSDADIVVDIGEQRIWADSGQVVEIVTNLVTNAIKYGSPPIEISAVSDGETTDISVADHGPGIPASMHDEVFEMGVRGAGHAGVEGNGLGLGIVRKLVEANAGTVRLESDPDTGTLFVVCLPARRAAAH